MFAIGFQGDTAIVDGKARKRYGAQSTAELAEEGMFKPAFCSAIYSGDEKEMEEFLSTYNASLPGNPYTRENLSRLFGVYGVPEGITRTKIID